MCIACNVIEQTSTEVMYIGAQQTLGLPLSYL
jgi:hypothetical protein